MESNNAFYRLPTRETFEGWRERTPHGFVMAVKASRYLTHIKRLRDPEEPVDRLLDRRRRARRQARPDPAPAPARPSRPTPVCSDRCLRCFPGRVRVAVEPRHTSWWTDEVRDVLTEHGAALCWADRHGPPGDAAVAHRRLGLPALPRGRGPPWPAYGDRALRCWTGGWPAVGADAYVYFNNDPGGAAVRNALRFAELSSQEGG